MPMQSAAGVRRVEPSTPDLVSETLEELVADLDIAAVHIGMLGSGKVVKAVADFLGRQGGKARLPNIVLDAILNSSSGTDLLDPLGRKLLQERVIPLADVVNPNTDEAFALTGIKGTGQDD